MYIFLQVLSTLKSLLNSLKAHIYILFNSSVRPFTWSGTIVLANGTRTWFFIYIYFTISVMQLFFTSFEITTIDTFFFWKAEVARVTAFSKQDVFWKRGYTCNFCCPKKRINCGNLKTCEKYLDSVEGLNIVPIIFEFRIKMMFSVVFKSQVKHLL